MDFFTADWHLNDEMILKACRRPFKTAARMTEVYVKQANQRAKTKADTIVHVGDFIQRGLDRGTGDRESQVSASEALASLSANVVLLEGNHDGSNRCRTAGSVLVRRLCGIDCVVQHYPSTDRRAVLPPSPGGVLVNVCGHVHDRWRFMYDEENQVLNVNVGIDVYPHMAKETDLALDVAKELKRLGLKAGRLLR